ncbi:MAG: Y-family DNA polymerase [Phocaeicola sp.]
MELFGLVDCNNFYCSCERLFRPELRNQPVVVLSNNDGCIIARSNESKALGIQMGEPLHQVRELLEKNKVAVFSSNYILYGDMSKRVMSLLSTYTPKLDIYSIDEAFMDLSGWQSTDELTHYCREMVKFVSKGTGIPISLGVAPTKTLAKMASKYAKKYPAYQGVCLMESDEKRERALKLFDVGDVWGIGRQAAKRLNYQGIRTAWDFTQKSEAWVRRELTITGVRTWNELRGVSCITIDELPQKKSICTSRSFAERGVSNKNLLEEAVANFASECARKLRQQQSCCSQITVFAYTSRFRTDASTHVIQQNIPLLVPTQAPTELIKAALAALRANYQTGVYSYKKAGVICYDLVQQEEVQMDLFDTIDRSKQKKLLDAIESINRKSGHNTIRVGSQGDLKQFKLKNEYLSKRYTTNLEEVIKLNTNQ